MRYKNGPRSSSPCFGIGHNLICQLTSEDIKHQFIIIIIIITPPLPVHSRHVALVTVSLFGSATACFTVESATVINCSTAVSVIVIDCSRVDRHFTDKSSLIYRPGSMTGQQVEPLIVVAVRIRVQELCEIKPRWPFWRHVPNTSNSPYVLCGRKATQNSGPKSSGAV